MVKKGDAGKYVRRPFTFIQVHHVIFQQQVPFIDAALKAEVPGPYQGLVAIGIGSADLAVTPISDDRKMWAEIILQAEGKRAMGLLSGVRLALKVPDVVGESLPLN